MAIVTDKQFNAGLKGALNASRSELWAELNELAKFLALVASFDEALAIWRFLYSGKLPFVPSEMIATIEADCVVSAVCFHLKVPDISKGHPLHIAVDRELPLAERVEVYDWYRRIELTMNEGGFTAVPTANERVRLLNRGYKLASPPAEYVYSEKELDALKTLCEYLDLPVIATNPSPGPATLNTSLLVIDIAYRHHLISEAESRLQRWYDFAVLSPNSFYLEEVFSFLSVSSLICKGALSHRTALKPDKRQRLVQQLLTEVDHRLSQPEPVKPPVTKQKISVFYDQFYLEPEQAPDVAYFDDPRESDQGFSSFPTHVAIRTPTDTAMCEVEIEFCFEPPSLKTGVQIVCIPLKVEAPGKLFLRSVGVDNSDDYFAVAPGEYDVVARFLKKRASREDAEAGLRAWRVLLSFLPSRSMKPQTIKVEHGDVPADVFVHT
jgi:hypothetical protein